MRRLASSLLILCLSGCAGRFASEPAPPQAPAPPVESPAKPPPELAKPKPSAATQSATEPERFQIWGNFATSLTPTDGMRLAADLDEVVAHATVRAAHAEEARGRITVEGAESWYQVRERSDRWEVDAHILPGPPGQEIRVTFQGDRPIVVTLTRQQGPSLSLQRQLPDGTWAEVAPGASLPPGPLKLRIKTTGGVKAAEVSSRFIGTYWGEKRQPDRFAVLADDLAEAAWDNPPPIIQVAAGGLKGDAGLRLPSDFLPHLHVGDPPRLVAIDPATGKEESLGEVPSGLYHGVIRSDGKRVALTGLDPVLLDSARTWLFDLERGTLVAVPFLSHYTTAGKFDSQGRLVQPLKGPLIGLLDPATGKEEVRRSAANYFGPLSPDGRYLVGHAGGPPGRSTGAWIPPARPEVLVIHDLEAGTEVVVPWEGFARRAMPLNWLPDGRLLQGVSLSDSPDDFQLSVYTVDLQTGARTPYPAEWQEPNPDYRQWGAPLTDVAGQLHTFGDGLPVGWLPDGRALVIRWENFHNRRQWMP